MLNMETEMKYMYCKCLIRPMSPRARNHYVVLDFRLIIKHFYKHSNFFVSSERFPKDFQMIPFLFFTIQCSVPFTILARTRLQKRKFWYSVWVFSCWYLYDYPLQNFSLCFDMQSLEVIDLMLLEYGVWIRLPRIHGY